MIRDADYPGKGLPWSDYLHHRRRVLLEWQREGKTPEECARDLSVDPLQVKLILWSGRAEVPCQIPGCGRIFGDCPHYTNGRLG